MLENQNVVRLIILIYGFFSDFYTKYDWIVQKTSLKRQFWLILYQRIHFCNKFLDIFHIWTNNFFRHKFVCRQSFDIQVDATVQASKSRQGYPVLRHSTQAKFWRYTQLTFWRRQRHASLLVWTVILNKEETVKIKNEATLVATLDAIGVNIP